MLSPGIGDAYRERSRAALRTLGADAVAPGSKATARATAAIAAALAGRPAAAVLADPQLLEEVFGPSHARSSGTGEAEPPLRRRAARRSAHGDRPRGRPTSLRGRRAPPGDARAKRPAASCSTSSPPASRSCPAMVHGGPFPATSDGRTTSVGTRAIERFTRLVAYQNAPAAPCRRSSRTQTRAACPAW